MTRSPRTEGEARAPGSARARSAQAGGPRPHGAARGASRADDRLRPTARADERRRGAEAPRRPRRPPARRARRRRPARPGLRVATLGVALALVAVLLSGRLAELQVLGGGQRYLAYGQSELYRVVSIPALRGPILDRQGGVLAMSVPTTEIYADPGEIRRSGVLAEARRLAGPLGLSVAAVADALAARQSFVVLAAHVDEAVAREVERLGEPGIGELAAAERFAPDGNLALPLLGWLSGDGTAGIAGLEEQYNSLLAGTAGLERVEVDPAGSVTDAPVRVLRRPVAGAGIQTTLSPVLQFEVEQLLGRGIVASGARAGWAVVEQPRTGDILAVASLVNEHGRAVPSPDELAFTDTFEPGSVMKLTTFSGALTDGLVTPTSTLSVPPDLVLGGRVFADAEPHGLETLTATQVIARSSNIGTIEIAERLTPSRVVAWMRRYGFGAPSGLHFPGESPGILKPASGFSASAIGSTPIGQDTGVTAIQLADAYNALASGGVFVPPRLVEAVVGPSGRRPLPTGRAHRVVPAGVAAELTQMLEHVVAPGGTAPDAAVPGYVVAGKTGTAQIPSSTSAGYVPGAFMGTFAGFVPAQHPAFTIVVVMDRPHADYGGVTAAPVFSQIAQFALRSAQIPPPASPVGPDGLPASAEGSTPSGG